MKQILVIKLSTDRFMLTDGAECQVVDCHGIWDLFDESPNYNKLGVDGSKIKYDRVELIKNLSKASNGDCFTLDFN